MFSHISKSMSVILRSGLSTFRKEMSSVPGVIETAIKDKLDSALEPEHLLILNESYMHNVEKGSETHFKVVVVSERFEGLSLIKRHRLVNHLLKEQLEGGVHALSIVAKTPKQWEDSDKFVEKSPNCRGGFGL